MIARLMQRPRPYIVCGIDVYLTEPSAKKNNAPLQLNRPISGIMKYFKGQAEHIDGQYFSGRCYAVLDQQITSFSSMDIKSIFTKNGNEKPYSSIDDVVIKINGLSEIAFIFERCILSSNPSATYIMTPLTPDEITGLFRNEHSELPLLQPIKK